MSAVSQATHPPGRLFVPIIGGKSADESRSQLCHMLPEPLGTVIHAAAGVVASLNGDGVVKLLPEGAEVKLLIVRRRQFDFVGGDDGAGLVRFVEESYSRKLSLEEIGRSVDMSPSSVCRYFKRRTHQNLWEYINSFRINRAAQLIVETQLPISEIGPRCGFTNVSNFNHLFRAHLGTTPSDYRSRFKTSPLTPDTTN